MLGMDVLAIVPIAKWVQVLSVAHLLLAFHSFCFVFTFLRTILRVEYTHPTRKLFLSILALCMSGTAAYSVLLYGNCAVLEYGIIDSRIEEESIKYRMYLIWNDCLPFLFYSFEFVNLLFLINIAFTKILSELCGDIRIFFLAKFCSMYIAVNAFIVIITTTVEHYADTSTQLIAAAYVLSGNSFLYYIYYPELSEDPTEVIKEPISTQQARSILEKMLPFTIYRVAIRLVIFLVHTQIVDFQIVDMILEMFIVVEPVIFVSCYSRIHSKSIKLKSKGSPPEEQPRAVS